MRIKTEDIDLTITPFHSSRELDEGISTQFGKEYVSAKLEIIGGDEQTIACYLVTIFNNLTPDLLIGIYAIAISDGPILFIVPDSQILIIGIDFSLAIVHLARKRTLAYFQNLPQIVDILLIKDMQMIICISELSVFSITMSGDVLWHYNTEDIIIDYRTDTRFC